MGNDKYHGGGTPKGVSKPKRNYTKETSGVMPRGYGDAYSDEACVQQVPAGEAGERGDAGEGGDAFLSLREEQRAGGRSQQPGDGKNPGRNQTTNQKKNDMSDTGRRDEVRRLWPAVCVDVETLDVRPTARILEIGAVCFDPESGKLGPQFSMEVSADGQQGRSVDAGTLLWWAEQQEQGLRMPCAQPGDPGRGLEAVKLHLTAFLATHTDSAKVQVWAWGTDFDLPILANAFPGHGWWRYHNQRCARTLCQELGVKREGRVIHRALFDAKEEARAVIAALAKCGEHPPKETIWQWAERTLEMESRGLPELAEEGFGGLPADGDFPGGIGTQADLDVGGAGAGEGDGGDVLGIDPGIAVDAGGGVDVAAVGDEEEARELHGLLGMMRDFAESDSVRFSSSVRSWCDGKPERMAAFRRMAGRRLEMRRAGVRLCFEHGMIVCEDA